MSVTRKLETDLTTYLTDCRHWK